MSDLVKRLRIKAGMIEMGELIEWGSDSALMREAADALEMAAPAEWDGAGLPPVSTKFEVHIYNNTWVKCTVVAHFEGRAVIVLDNREAAQIRPADHLRPIRTPEQIAAEKREREINGLAAYIKLAKALHNAGRRKTEQEKNND